MAEITRLSVVALDIVLDEGISRHPLKEQRQSVADWRQIGLGIFGLADLLIKHGVTYGSKEAIEISETLGSIILNSAIKTSANLAKEYGHYSKFNCRINDLPFMENVTASNKTLIENYGLRHSQLLTIAPTGTLSTMLGVSGGIEPIFANSYTRKTESLHGEDKYYKVYTPIVESFMNDHNLVNEEELPEYFITSSNVLPTNRIKMQSAWQQRIDAAISSTINLPENTTVEEVENIYLEAWRRGLKGVTVFRNNCARTGILTTNEPHIATQDLVRGDWKNLASDTVYEKIKLKIGCGKLVLFVGWSDSEQAIQDFYVKRAGTGGCEKTIETTTISMSAILRLGGSLHNIEKAFEGISACNSFVSRRAKGGKLSKGTSCGTAIMYALQDFEKLKKGVLQEKPAPAPTSVQIEIDVPTGANSCPECGETMINEGGCVMCKMCGWSKCS